jgi:serine/threonine-protein kinase
MRALAPLPENRFAMASELQRAIENAMVEAQCETTHAGVAAFLAEQVADGAQKRKAIIAQGLKAMAERQASQEDADATPARASSVPPMKTGSTIRPAALEVALPPPPNGRAWVRATIVVGAVLAVGGLAIVATSPWRARAKANVSASGPEGASPAMVPAAAQAVAPSSASSPSAGEADVPTVDVSQLPVAPATGSVATGQFLPVPPSRALAPAHAGAPPPPKHAARVKVDDGF